MMRMIAIVSSMGPPLRRSPHGASWLRSSNRCATRVDRAVRGSVLVVFAAVAVVFVTAEMASAQAANSNTAVSSEQRASDVPPFLAGAAAALGAHESGHLLFDVIFGAKPEIRKVSFHGVPFFAISHRPGLPWREEFTIDSAGFWVQHAGS